MGFSCNDSKSKVYLNVLQKGFFLNDRIAELSAILYTRDTTVLFYFQLAFKNNFP